MDRSRLGLVGLGEEGMGGEPGLGVLVEEVEGGLGLRLHLHVALAGLEELIPLRPQAQELGLLPPQQLQLLHHLNQTPHHFHTLSGGAKYPHLTLFSSIAPENGLDLPDEAGARVGGVGATLLHLNRPSMIGVKMENNWESGTLVL